MRQLTAASQVGPDAVRPAVTKYTESRGVVPRF